MFYALEGVDTSQFHIEGNMGGIRDAIIDIETYTGLFMPAGKTAVTGEASTVYLANETTPMQIYRHRPDTKIIAILRNPIERAYSHFKHFRRDGFEPLSSFSEAYQAEEERKESNWFQSYFYLEAGFYASQIQRYLEYFPAEQMKFFLFEDLQNADVMMRDIFAFLGVETNISLDTKTRHNPSGKLRLPALYQRVHTSQFIKPVLRKIIPPKLWGSIRGVWEKLLIKKGDSLSKEVYEQLLPIFSEDITELQTILDRDLTHWLTYEK